MVPYLAVGNGPAPIYLREWPYRAELAISDQSIGIKKYEILISRR